MWWDLETSCSKSKPPSDRLMLLCSKRSVGSSLENHSSGLTFWFCAELQATHPNLKPFAVIRGKQHGLSAQVQSCVQSCCQSIKEAVQRYMLWWKTMAFNHWILCDWMVPLAFSHQCAFVWPSRTFAINTSLRYWVTTLIFHMSLIPFRIEVATCRDICRWSTGRGGHWGHKHRLLSQSRQCQCH